MSFATEIQQASTANVALARAAAQGQGLPGIAVGEAAREGRWISVHEILRVPVVQALTADDRRKAETLLMPYAQAGWMISPGAGAGIDAMLGNSSFRIGGVGSPPLGGADDYQQFVTVVRVVDGLIEAASLFVAHGRPTAPKSTKYDGIAVKFEDDHLCSDQKDAVATTERRAIERSTMLRSDQAPFLSREITALNNASYFQYVEAFLQKMYNWVPSYVEVESIVYVSRERVTVAWNMTGTASTPGGPIDTFTKPTKVTGHLVYAVKPDQADPNVATDMSKCKRLLYHFESLLVDPDVPPNDRWVPISIDSVLKAVKLKPGMEEAIRAAAVRCYYRATVD